MNFVSYREPQNLFGVRPIHIAEKMGSLNIVKFFMEQTIVSQPIKVYIYSLYFCQEIMYHNIYKLLKIKIL